MKNPWKKLPLKYRKEVTSFLITLIVAVGAAFYAWLETDAPLSWATLAAVLGSGARSGLRIAFGRFFLKK